MQTALARVRVLALSRAFAGAFRSMILGNSGAEIIKSEALGTRTEVTGHYSYRTGR